MKKLWLSLMVLWMLVGCTNIPEGFDKATLETKTVEVIKLMEDMKSEEVITLLRSDLQALITADELRKNLKTKYDSVGSSTADPVFTISDTKDPQTSEIYATVIAQVTHESGKVTYTISFNKDYELVGLYIK